VADEAEHDGMTGIVEPALLGASRVEADASLRRWRDLLDLQIEDLKREDSLRHWSLRVRHISDVLKLGFELAVAFIVLAIAVALGAAIWQAAHADGLVIQSFNVPADMTARGLSGQVAAAKLLDRLNALQNLSLSSRPASSFSNDWTNDIKVEIPDTGVSLGEVVRYLHSWLGHETQLSGDVYETANALSLTVRLGDAPAQTFTGGDLDTLVQKAGEAIFAEAQPYRYATYLLASGRRAAGAAMLEKLAASGNTKDRAWANDGLAVTAIYAGEYARAMHYAQNALQADPDFPYPWLLRTTLALDQSHDEDALASARIYARELRAHGADELGTDGLNEKILQSRALVAEALGDYRNAVKACENGFGPVATIDPHLIDDVALMHDPRGTGVLIASLPANVASPQGFVSTARAKAFALGLAAVDETNWRAAAELFRHASGFLWGTSRPDVWLALASAKLGQMAKADAILKTLPDDCDICVRMKGRIAAMSHRYAEAARDFAIVAARSPDIPFAYADWGAMLLHEGKFDAAIAKFKTAHQKGPHFADPLEMWGEALIAKNRSDLALAKFEEADKYAPNWGRLHLKWAEALLWSGDHAGAKRQFAIAARLDLRPQDRAELARLAKG
jgi:tetratricopeptide (TPR) repeat protein